MLRPYILTGSGFFKENEDNTFNLVGYSLINDRPYKGSVQAEDPWYKIRYFKIAFVDDDNLIASFKNDPTQESYIQITPTDNYLNLSYISMKYGPGAWIFDEEEEPETYDLEDVMDYHGFNHSGGNIRLNNLNLIRLDKIRLDKLRAPTNLRVENLRIIAD